MTTTDTSHQDSLNAEQEGYKRPSGRLRLRYQLLQRQAGDRPSDLLTVDRLSSIDRSLVAEAVREIASIQRRMTNVAHFLPAQGWVGAERR